MEPFIHLPEYPFIICRTCRIGLVASEVIGHTKRHAEISRQQAQSIRDTVRAIPGVAKDQAGLEHWPLPKPCKEPIPYIEPPVLGMLGCSACPYVVREIRRMQEHCRTQHGWINDWKKGGNVAYRARQTRPPVPWRSNVRCQRICNWGHGKRWFEVGRGMEDEQPPPIEGDEWDTVGAFFNRMYQEDEEAFQKEAEATIRDIDDKWEAQAWLSRCGWPQHLDGVDPTWLRGTLQPIGDKEPVLQRMWAIFDSVLEQAYAAASQCSPGSAELFEIERKETTVTTTKPFQRLMEPEAWSRYKERWRVLLSIWHRLESRVQDNGQEADSDTDSDTDGARTTERKRRRPPYRMTTQQERLWNKFTAGVTTVVAEADADGRLTQERLERYCLDAVVGFLDHPLKSGNHYESILLSALAVMGLDPKGGWVSVANYTPVYSTVIKVARYLVLHQSMLEREAQVRRRQQGTGVGRRTAEESVDGLFRIVRRKVRRFMTRVSGEEDAEPTPMNWIINTRTYGMRVRFMTPGSETVDWRGDQIVHGQVRLGMGHLSDMLHSLVGEARRTLARLTMTDPTDGYQAEDDDEPQHQPPVQELLPRIPWSRIEDRHGESGLEHSFLRDEANEWWTKAGHGWVKDQIVQSGARRKAWLGKSMDERCPYREKAIRRYERDVEQFRAQIWMLMHMMGGQPARSTEILGLRMWNTTNAGVRNIFIHEGMVCFVTMYHKGFRTSGKIKIIHRYLPREIGELLVWYMWLVLPFWQTVQGRIKQKRRRSAFLWADEVVSDEGGKEKKARQDHVHQDQKKGDLKQQAVEDEEREEEAAFMEWFRERKWTSDRARRVMQQYSTQFSGQELNISAWRHIAIGISNRYFNKVFGSGEDGDGHGDEVDHEGGGSLVDSIYDLQAGHGSHIAGLIYARMFGQGDLGSMRSREEFRKVSMQWHRFFGFGAEDRAARGLPAAGAKRARPIFDVEREDMRRQRFGRLHRIDIHSQLRQMMGHAATFRGLQEPVIRAVARGEWPILQVTPTGGGKSLTFMLPAFCTPDGVTIVVTPLVALQDDMGVRCARMGIDAYVWRSRGLQRAASLVFVTPESAVTKGFREFVERMHQQQKLDRVVVDECHTVMEYTKTFRPQIRRLGGVLQDFGVPIICLTATLKPTQETALFKELRLHRGRVHIFREPTTRRNIRYSVETIEDGHTSEPTRKNKMNGCTKRARANRVNSEGEEEGEDDDIVEQRVCEYVRSWTAAHGEGKVIIYGGTIARVRRIAAALGCPAYWRGSGNAVDKGRRVEQWRASTGGPSGWIAATNALGLGIDVPDVRLVIHAGIPRTLTRVAQESGRGGRDGQRSESVVVIRRSWLEQQVERNKKQKRDGIHQADAAATCTEQPWKGDGKEKEEEEWSWDDDVVEYAKGSCCRRELFDREMDGRTDRFRCKESEEEVCDVCQRQQAEREVRAWSDAGGFEFEEEDDKAVRQEQKEEDAMDMDYRRSQQTARQRETERTVEVMQEASEVSAFEAMLADWDGDCAVCRVTEQDDMEHDLEACPQRDSRPWRDIRQGIEAVEQEMFGRRRFAMFSACFDCGLPQAICGQWIAASQDGRLFRKAQGKKCQYRGLLVRIFVAQRIRMLDTWTDDVAKLMGADTFDVHDRQQMGKLYSWLGALVEWGGRAGGGIQASRMCQVVTRLERRC